MENGAWVTRWQIPLALGYALSIHRSQVWCPDTLNHQYCGARRLSFSRRMIVSHNTVHRGTQGMTLDRLEVDLRSAFEAGQVYVALSRARSLAGLTVLGFDPAKVRAHPAAVEFTRGLQRCGSG